MSAFIFTPWQIQAGYSLNESPRVSKNANDRKGVGS